MSSQGYTYSPTPPGRTMYAPRVPPAMRATRDEAVGTRKAQRRYDDPEAIPVGHTYPVSTSYGQHPYMAPAYAYRPSASRESQTSRSSVALDGSKSSAERHPYEPLSDQSARKPAASPSTGHAYPMRQSTSTAIADYARSAKRLPPGYDMRIEELVRRYNEQLKEVPFEQKRESQFARSAHFAHYASYYGRPPVNSVADEFLDYYRAPKRPSPTPTTSSTHLATEQRDQSLASSQSGTSSGTRLTPSRSQAYHPFYAPSSARNSRLSARGSVLPSTHFSSSDRDHFMFYNAHGLPKGPGKAYSPHELEQWKRERAFARQLATGNGTPDLASRKQRKDETSSAAFGMRVAPSMTSAKPTEVINLVDDEDEDDAADIALRSSARLPRFRVSRQDAQEFAHTLDGGRAKSREHSPHAANNVSAPAVAKLSVSPSWKRSAAVVADQEHSLQGQAKQRERHADTTRSVSSEAHKQDVRSTSPYTSGRTARHTVAMESSPIAAEERPCSSKSTADKDENASEVAGRLVSPRRTRSGSRISTSPSVKRKAAESPPPSEEIAEPENDAEDVLPPKAKRRKFGRLQMRYAGEGTSSDTASEKALERPLSPESEEGDSEKKDAQSRQRMTSSAEQVTMPIASPAASPMVPHPMKIEAEEEALDGPVRIPEQSPETLESAQNETPLAPPPITLVGMDVDESMDEERLPRRRTVSDGGIRQRNTLRPVYLETCKCGGCSCPGRGVGRVVGHVVA